MIRFQRHSFILFCIGAMLLFRCATDPGTNTPITSGAVIFTYASGTVRVIVNVDENSITAAAVLFDTHPTSGVLTEATSVEDGVVITWPDELSFEIPDCSDGPTLIGSTTYTTAKLFNYTKPESCIFPSDASGQATLIVTKNGLFRTINDTTSGVTNQTFTNTGTWTAPVGITSVTIECWGGGGGGKGGASGNGSEGGGGGGYSRKTSIAVTPGNTYTVNVGTGGAGGTVSSNPGADGGDSWFSSTLTVLAKGGAGGNGSGGSGGLASSGVGDTKFSGGTGGTQTGGAYSAGGGSSGGTAANGNNGQNSTVGSSAGEAGGVAPTGGGAGGAGGGASVGVAGTFPGGGGGGGGGLITGFSGGAGAAGKLIIDW